MMNRKLILIFFILVLSLNVYSYEYNFNDVKCFGKALYQINDIQGDNNFTFIGCDNFATTNNKYFACDCQKNISIIYSEDTNIAFRVQYYVAPPREIAQPNITNPSADELYNQGIQRIETFNILMKVPPVKEKSILELLPNLNIVFYIVGVILLIIFIVIVFSIYVFINSETLKKRLGKGADEKMTLKEVFIAIFSRPDIKPKKLNKGEITQEYNDKNTSNIENEISDLLKDL